jgi:large subunit ribosomal protein L29
VKASKLRELKEMTNEELADQMKGLKQELFNLRFQSATGQLGNVMVIQKTKKDIARVKTIIRERELKSAMES